MASGSSRIITTKPRSESISDVRKLDAILSTLTDPGAAGRNTTAEAGAGGANDSLVQELTGVFLKRLPATIPAVDGKGTVPSYDYQIDNKRDYRVKVVMDFSGNNVKVTPGPNAKQPKSLTIEAILEKGASAKSATVTAADGKSDFAFSAEVKVYPDQDDIREADLEGVKLFTAITYEDMFTVMSFDAENTRDFDVEVELDLKGKLAEQSGSLPYSKIIPAGKKAHIGKAKSDAEIESSWKWQQIMDSAASAPPGAATGQPGSTVAPSAATGQGNRTTQTSELKGVTLKQTMAPQAPGEPTLIEFEVTNSRDKKISVSIDLEGEGYINFRSQSRPLTGEVFGKQTAFIGAVEIKGDATVNWKYREEA